MPRTPEEQARALETLHDAMFLLEENQRDLELAASDPSTEPAWLEGILSTPTGFVLRSVVAANPSTPSRVLRALAAPGSSEGADDRALYHSDDTDEVLAALATNPSLPQDVLEGLLDQSDVRVRALARRHPRAPLARLHDVPVADLALRVNLELLERASADMALTLAESWRGTLAELFEAVEALDEDVS